MPVIMQDAWKSAAKILDGQVGTHSYLVAFAKANGFDTEPDGADNELTYLARPGAEAFGRRVIGEIRGGHKAVARIMVRI